MYSREHYFEVGTCKVDADGRFVTDVYHTTESTYDSAVHQFDRLIHRESAGVTAYITEFKINRAEGTGNVCTIRKEAI